MKDSNCVFCFDNEDEKMGSTFSECVTAEWFLSDDKKKWKLNRQVKLCFIFWNNTFHHSCLNQP